MYTIDRRAFMKGMGAALAVGPAYLSYSPNAFGDDAITTINPSFCVTPDEAIAWHTVKDKLGPALAGNASWRNYVEFVEDKLREYGVVDVTRNAWAYDRWHTSEWPDDSKWSLLSNGEKVRVANYAANSGKTTEAGLTADLVFYDPASPPVDVAGKIVVFEVKAAPERVSALADLDHEFKMPDDSYPEQGNPIPDNIVSTSAAIFAQLTQIMGFIPILEKGNAAGAVYVLDASYDQAAGMYTFPVPDLHAIPSLYLDREAGAAVIADAKAGATATLTLIAEVTPTETWQLISFLPGKNYGKPEDELIQLTTHSDGPSISQDNGPLGLLGIVKYFSNIPQTQRPRTLLVFIDCRHYMPGQERKWHEQDWFVKNPAARDNVIAVVGMEHLGQVEFVDDADGFHPSGRVDQGQVWATHNQTMINAAIEAVKDNNVVSQAVRCVDRPGVNGKSQGIWFGLAAFARREGFPAFATMGTMGAYWATPSRINRLDAPLFCAQIAAFAQLTGELMLADPAKIQSGKTAE